MKIIFFTQDESVHEVIDQIGNERFHVTDSKDELEDLFEDALNLLFIDYDFPKKKVAEKVNNQQVGYENIIRIIFSEKLSVKDVKKHQKSKKSADAYLFKPLSPEIILGLIDDFELSLAQNSHEDYGTSEELNTEIRATLKEHDQDYDNTQFNAKLSEKIQDKFDTVFTSALPQSADDSHHDELDSADLEKTEITGGFKLGLPDEEIEEQKSPEKTETKQLDTEEEIADELVEIEEYEATEETEYEGLKKEDQTQEIGDTEESRVSWDELDLSTSDEPEMLRTEEVEEESLAPQESPDDKLPQELAASTPRERTAPKFEALSEDETSNENLKVSEEEKDEITSEETSDGQIDSSVMSESIPEEEQVGSNGFKLGVLGGNAENEEVEVPVDTVKETSKASEGEIEFGINAPAEDENEEDALQFDMKESNGTVEDSEEVGIDFEIQQSEEPAAQNGENGGLSFGISEEQKLEEENEIEQEKLTKEEDVKSPSLVLDMATLSEEVPTFNGADEAEMEEADLELPDMNDGQTEDESPQDTSEEKELDVVEAPLLPDVPEHSYAQKEVVEFEEPTAPKEVSIKREEDVTSKPEMEIEEKKLTPTTEPSTPMDRDLDIAQEFFKERTPFDKGEEKLEKIDKGGNYSDDEVTKPFTSPDLAESIAETFSEDEMVKMQSIIRELRLEREELYGQINELKKEKKLLEHDNLGLRAELDEVKIELSMVKKNHIEQVNELRYDNSFNEEKKAVLEKKVKEYKKEFDRLGQKVRIDFGQIKQREKELEGQLELAKMDTITQVKSRDSKILELKRKIDSLEFNMENVSIQEQKTKEDNKKLDERLKKIMKTLRGTVKLLEDDIDEDFIDSIK